MSRSAGSPLHLLEQLEARHVRQPQVDDAAVERAARAALRALPPPVPTAVDLDVVVREQLDDALPLDVVVLDDQQALACAARRTILMRSNACSRSSVVAGLTR